ncbi:hypothetical protein AB0M50_41695 [Nonomuraea fuscirosea]
MNARVKAAMVTTTAMVSSVGAAAVVVHAGRLSAGPPGGARRGR